MLKFGINYCRADGISAICLAQPIDQQFCDGYSKSTIKNCCMWFGQMHDAHCGNPHQHDAYREIGVVTASDMDQQINEETVSIEDYIVEEEEEKIPSCLSCGYSAICTSFFSMGKSATPEDYDRQAASCPDYNPN